MKDFYKFLTLRNSGYIDDRLQERVSKSSVLIAGCGIGSQVAESATRIGFQKFILVDADKIDCHNLNRQSFYFDQVGKFKVEALKDNILRINPDAEVEIYKEFVTKENANILVSKADIIFDTIDFLDLKAIVALHDEAHAQSKNLVSAFGVGFGAAVICLPPNERKHSWIRDIFDLPKFGDIGDISYVERYIKLFSNVASGLDPQVLMVMQKVFKDLADGVQCPAPQVAPGSYAVAATSLTAALRMLDDVPIATAPEMTIINISGALLSKGIQLIK